MGCIDCGGRGDLTGVVHSDWRGVASPECCSCCGLVYLDEWSEGFISELYEYYGKWIDRPVEALYPEVNARRIMFRLESLEPLVCGRRLLDVGCGHGGFVRTARAVGWDAAGIEQSSSALAVCERFELPCSLTDFFGAALNGERYDVIVMSELIEHVPAPRRYLSRARQLLAPGGVVYLTTPNWDSLGRRVLKGDWQAVHREHLSYFTPATLVSCAGNAGLRPERVWTENLSLAVVRKLLRRQGNGQADCFKVQEFRAEIESSRLLRAVKAGLNVGLNAMGLGESLKAVLRACEPVS